MLTPGQQDKIREEEERIRDEEIFRAKVRKSLPGLPLSARIPKVVTVPSLITGILLWVLTAGLIAGVSVYWKHRDEARAQSRERDHIKAEMESRLTSFAGSLQRDRFQLVFTYPPKREAMFRERLYDDVQIFLDKSPAQAPGALLNLYPDFVQMSGIVLAQHIADLDSAYGAGRKSFVCLDNFTKGWREHPPNLFSTEEEAAQDYAGMAWKSCLVTLPEEWKRLLASSFQSKVVVYD